MVSTARLVELLHEMADRVDQHDIGGGAILLTAASEIERLHLELAEFMRQYVRLATRPAEPPIP